MTSIFTVDRFIFLALSVLVLLAKLLGWQGNEEWVLYLLICLVVVAGLPHGALDPLVARQNGLWRTPLGLTTFLFGYLLISGLALLGWVFFPGISLALFLLYSAWHFSGDWRDSLPRSTRFWQGMVIVCFPVLGNDKSVQSIYTILAGSSAADLIVEASLWLALPAALGSVLSCLYLLAKKDWAILELITLAFLALLLPPLIFFLIYFCFLHSPRHFFSTVRNIPWTQTVPLVIIFTLLTVALGCFAYGNLPARIFSESMLRIIFIGLSVLTIPHMLLIENSSVIRKICRQTKGQIRGRILSQKTSS